MVWPASAPTSPSSKPGIKLFEPSSSIWSVAAPPSKASPSIRPVKSIRTTSPNLALRFFSTFFVGLFSLARRSRVASISVCATSIVGLSIFREASSGMSIAGITSIFSRAFRSLPSSYDVMSRRGWLASFSS